MYFKQQSPFEWKLALRRLGLLCSRTFNPERPHARRERGRYADFPIMPRFLRCARSIAFRHNFDGTRLAARCFCFAIARRRSSDLQAEVRKAMNNAPKVERKYEGAASYYSRYRPPYPPALVTVLREAFRLDGKGQLLDLGSGPGSVAIPVAHLFERVVAMDPETNA
jgi:hypothetical protein